MNERIKRSNDELKADRPTISEVKFIPRLPISILVENVRSVHNVGSIFRSADGFGADKIYLSGYTAHPPREDLHKTALGSEDAVPWEYFKNPIDAAKAINAKSGRTTPDTNNTSGAIKESDVQKMSTKEYEKHSEEIMEAIRSGNFIYDLSGNAR